MSALAELPAACSILLALGMAALTWSLLELGEWCLSREEDSDDDNGGPLPPVFP